MAIEKPSRLLTRKDLNVLPPSSTDSKILDFNIVPTRGSDQTIFQLALPCLRYFRQGCTMPSLFSTRLYWGNDRAATSYDSLHMEYQLQHIQELPLEQLCFAWMYRGKSCTIG